MENKIKINIAELLKDCPTGMELDCTMYEDVYFDYVDELNNIRCYIQQKFNKTSVIFNQDGTPNSHTKSKCVIFPKEKTTWEGFQRPFEDGDVVATSSGTWIGITTGDKSCEFMPTYCVIKGDSKFEAYLDKKGTWQFSRFATEEEKKKLFDAIKENGYKWNAETKTLERSIEPKFKDGDILFVKATYSWIIIYKESENEGGLYKYVGIPMGIPDYPDYTFMVYDCNPLCCKDDISEIRLATEEEKKKLFDAIKENGYRWNPETKTLEKAIQPKFKVGDKVAKKCNMSNPISIIRVGNQYYYHYSNTEHDVEVLPIAEQDDWELVLDKFDITTLVPFESRVLIRNDKHSNWKPAIFGCCMKDRSDSYYSVLGGTCWIYCIPYEGNEHLCGTTNDCDEYYKTWE